MLKYMKVEKKGVFWVSNPITPDTREHPVKASIRIKGVKLLDKPE